MLTANQIWIIPSKLSVFHLNSSQSAGLICRVSLANLIKSYKTPPSFYKYFQIHRSEQSLYWNTVTAELCVSLHLHLHYIYSLQYIKTWYNAENIVQHIQFILLAC